MAKFTALEGKFVTMSIDNVDTDQIIPARFLKTISKVGLGAQLFNDWRYNTDGGEKPEFILNQAESKAKQILLAGDNFGCGSSREHAPWALTQYGFRALLSTSFADIFKQNSLKNGLLPIVVSKDIHAWLFANPESSVKIDLVAQTLMIGDGRSVAFPVDPFAKNCLIEGVDELGYILKQEAAIAQFESGRLGSLNTLA